MSTQFYRLSVRVLFYKEGDQFVAHALELDLLGYGNTEAEAAQELQEAIDIQIAYSSIGGNEDVLFHPAPKKFFKQWETAHAAALRGALTGGVNADVFEIRAAMLPVGEEMADMTRRERADFVPISEGQLG